MSLNFGPKQLAIPGPSVMPERVLSAMHRPSPNIYEGDLLELTDTLYPDLKTVAQTKGEAAIYIANGHGAWEAAIANTLSRGDRVLVLATGRFAHGWGEIAESQGIQIEEIDFGMQADADPDQLEAALRADTDGKIKAVLVVQTDTATSVLNDVPALRKAIDAAGHDALFMVDCIASLGCDEYRMDEWGVDVTVAACQKGLMTPAGMAFVFFNEKAAAARKNANPSFYWDWKLRANSQAFYQKFAGTAPTHHLYGLRAALDILVYEEGIEASWARHDTIAHSIWAALEVWGSEGQLVHNIDDHAKRSRAVSAITTAPDAAVRIREWSENFAGVTLGIGLGFGEPGSAESRRHFRIGHMGHQNIPATMGVLASIDCALKALEIPHGDGALEAATKVLVAHKGTDAKPMEKAATVQPSSVAAASCCT